MCACVLIILCWFTVYDSHRRRQSSSHQKQIINSLVVYMHVREPLYVHRAVAATQQTRNRSDSDTVSAGVNIASVSAYTSVCMWFPFDRKGAHVNSKLKSKQFDTENNSKQSPKKNHSNSVWTSDWKVQSRQQQSPSRPVLFIARASLALDFYGWNAKKARPK